MTLYGTKTYKAAVGEHEVAFEFDRTGVIVNRGRLYVDGAELDKRAVHYGESTLTGKLPDGRSFKVEFGSGFVGQLKFVELVLDDERIPLEEVAH
ncbi:MAG: hypothetical protein WKF48_05045 [Solirubrobacteraceae bacterium]